MKINPNHVEGLQLIEEFVETMRPQIILNLRQRYGLSEDDSEDIFQDSFVTLWENICQCKMREGTNSIRAYFMGICRNKAFNHIRSRGKHVMLPMDSSTPHLPSFVEQRVEKLLQLDQDNETLRAKKENIVQKIVCHLPHPCDELLWGYYRDRLSTKTLAKQLGYASENVVKVTKHRCLEKFRKMFEQYKKMI